MDNLSYRQMRKLERQLQQVARLPWEGVKTPPAVTNSHAKEMSDALQAALSAHNLEPSETTLVRLVSAAKTLEAAGFHPLLIGENKLPTGICVIRVDVWQAIQKHKEEKCASL